MKILPLSDSSIGSGVTDEYGDWPWIGLNAFEKQAGFILTK
jgi:hypothetical protein